MKLSNQAMGAIMMALQKSLMEQSDITETLGGFEFLLDGLSGTMMLLVTGLGLVIQIFSTSYMSGDPRYVKYFVYFNFFVFSMLLLVMSANFLVMFFGWELVGLSSYLLISFWSEKKEAAKAGNKAFVLNRIGDFGFVLGIVSIFFIFGTIDLDGIFLSLIHI